MTSDSESSSSDKSRFLLFAPQDDPVLNLYKKSWRGRFYKNLKKKGPGWSFPDEFREDIIRAKAIVSTTTSPRVEEPCKESTVSVQDPTCQVSKCDERKSSDAILPSLCDRGTQTEINETVAYMTKRVPVIPPEIQLYFQNFLESLHSRPQHSPKKGFFDRTKSSDRGRSVSKNTDKRPPRRPSN